MLAPDGKSSSLLQGNLSNAFLKKKGTEGLLNMQKDLTQPLLSVYHFCVPCISAIGSEGALSVLAMPHAPALLFLRTVRTLFPVNSIWQIYQYRCNSEPIERCFASMAQPSVVDFSTDIQVLHFFLTPIEKPAGEYFCAIEAKKWSWFFSSETVVISALNRREMTSTFILASGFAIFSLSLSNIDLKGWGFLLALLLGGELGVVLAVPLALSIGEVLTWYLNPALVSIDPRFYTSGVALRFVFDAVVNMPGIAIRGICFGSYLGVYGRTGNNYEEYLLQIFIFEYVASAYSRDQFKKAIASYICDESVSNNCLSSLDMSYRPFLVEVS